MIRETIAPDGTIYPAYGCNNNDDYKKIQPKDAPQIIYVIKANGTNNSKIHGNCFTMITSGHVKFLIKETEAKNKLLSTKVGRSMNVQQRVERLMPHEMTTRLFEEMANLKMQSNGLEIKLEQISTRHFKDKFSSLEYGLWRIKELEDEYITKSRRQTGRRQLTFFTGGE